MGAQIPIASFPTRGNEAATNPTANFQYRSIGTNIDCTASSTDDGRFRVDLSVEDSSVYGESQATPSRGASPNPPSFNTFSATASLILRDGQTSQFTAATDKVSGETVKIDVTVNVVK
jgi:type II secretory pathway component GspD/PulD (secretin)